MERPPLVPLDDAAGSAMLTLFLDGGGSVMVLCG